VSDTDFFIKIIRKKVLDLSSGFSEFDSKKYIKELIRESLQEYILSKILPDSLLLELMKILGLDIKKATENLLTNSSNFIQCSLDIVSVANTGNNRSALAKNVKRLFFELADLDAYGEYELKVEYTHGLFLGLDKGLTELQETAYTLAEAAGEPRKRKKLQEDIEKTIALIVSEDTQDIFCQLGREITTVELKKFSITQKQDIIHVSRDLGRTSGYLLFQIVLGYLSGKGVGAIGKKASKILKKYKDGALDRAVNRALVDNGVNKKDRLLSDIPEKGEFLPRKTIDNPSMSVTNNRQKTLNLKAKILAQTIKIFNRDFMQGPVGTKSIKPSTKVLIHIVNWKRRESKLKKNKANFVKGMRRISPLTEPLSKKDKKILLKLKKYYLNSKKLSAIQYNSFSTRFWKNVWDDMDARRKLLKNTKDIDSIWSNAEKRNTALERIGIRWEKRGNNPQSKVYNTKTQTFEWHPLNIDHFIRQTDNPWLSTNPKNLDVTTAIENQQYLESYRKFMNEQVTDKGFRKYYSGMGKKTKEARIDAIDYEIADFIIINKKYLE